MRAKVLQQFFSTLYFGQLDQSHGSSDRNTQSDWFVPNLADQKHLENRIKIVLTSYTIHTISYINISIYLALCSTLVLRPGINSAGSYFFPKSVLSDVSAHDLMISGHWFAPCLIILNKKIFKKKFQTQF